MGAAPDVASSPLIQNGAKAIHDVHAPAPVWEAFALLNDFIKISLVFQCDKKYFSWKR